MICKKCGNEITENELYCGKCGAKVGNQNTDKKAIKIKFSHLMIGIIVLVIVLGIICIKSLSNKDIRDKAIESANRYRENQVVNNYQGTTQETPKEYYDFIDTNYYTLNITESEFISRIMQGNTYISQGYSKTTATTPNKNLYTKASYPITQTIGITTNPTNNKIVKIECMLLGNVAEMELNEMATNTLENIIVWILNINNNDNDNLEYGAQLLTELLDKSSRDKGILFDYTLSSDSSANMNSATISIEIIK